MRTLVVLPNWVGDTILALPVLAALAAASRRLSVLCRPHLGPLLETQPSVHEVVLRAVSDAETVHHLRRAKFEEAVILPNSIRSAWLAYKAEIPRRWGYAGTTPEGLVRRFILPNSVRDRRDRARHQTEDYHDLLSAMEVAAPLDWVPGLAVTADQREIGRQLLTRSGLHRHRVPLIGLFGGAEFGPSKQWPWQRFAELSQQFRKHLPNSQQTILAGPKETWLAVRIHEESGKIHPVIGPDLDLAQLAAVIANLDLLVTNDSGPMHMAAALGVPCLALFGPTDPRRTRPVGDRHEVFYSDRWCSPCFRRRCPLLHHRCMKDITVDQVAARALQMLDADSKPL